MNVKTMNALVDFAGEQKGRKIDPAQLTAQIGRMNIFAISGGRVLNYGESTTFFPVASGYYVAVTLEANDTYTVRRLFVRAGKVTVKTEAADVYADEVGEVAYQASCFR